MSFNHHKLYIKQNKQPVVEKKSNNNLDENILNQIMHHIKSFPCEESHYSVNSKKYLSADLNINRMYLHFIEIHDKDNLGAAKNGKYKGKYKRGTYY